MHKDITLYGRTVRVVSTQIIGTAVTVFSAWEISPRRERDGFPSHSSLRTWEDTPRAFWGKLSTRELSEEIDALPVGEARSYAVYDYHRSLDLEARLAILIAFPEAARGDLAYGGELEIIG